MKFYSIQELWHNLDENVTDPQQIAKDFDCPVLEKALPTHIYGFTEPISQYIFINGSLDNQFKKFVIAHELIHALLDDTPSYLSTLSNVNTIKKEARANKGAFLLLLRHYLSFLSPETINLSQFMDFYNIPNKYLEFFNQCLLDCSLADNKKIIV